MPSILGLLSTESFSAERFTNIRRSVFYFYPNGAAPLTGILSLLQEEDTDDPRFTWHEKRLDTQSTTTVALNATGPMSTPVNSAAQLNTTDAPGSSGTGGFSITQYQYANVAVADATKFRVNHVVKLTGFPVVATTVGNVQGNVTDVVGIVVGTSPNTAPQFISLQFVNAYANLRNDNGAGYLSVGLEAWVVGNSTAQGIGDISSQIYNLPIDIENFCQIFRTPFSMTGTALKTSAKFDESGPYRDKSKEASIYHMIEIEKNLIFGQKSLQSVDPISGLPRYTTGGILYWLNQWELGVAGGGPYGNTQANYDTDDNKRIIVNPNGTINLIAYNTYLERLFRVTNNIANEKLCLCGSGFLSVMNQLYENRTNFTTNVPMEDAYGMNVVRHVTPYGVIYYKSHPLFSQNANLRYNGLFLDVQNLRYRFVQGRDTMLAKNRQPNDADYRKDEWIGESGLELRFPESHMYLQNVKAIAN